MSETFSSGQRNERSLSSWCDLWALGGWGASLLLLLLLLLLIPRMPLCPCHHWALSLAPPVVLLVLFFLMSKWMMVTASYKQVLGKREMWTPATHSRGTENNVALVPLSLSGIRSSPGPGNPAPSRGCGAGTRAWHAVPARGLQRLACPSASQWCGTGMAPCPLHRFSSCGAQMNHFILLFWFSFAVACLLFWGSPADQIDLTRWFIAI